MMPKSKGSGIISDFVDERNGYLELTQEYEEAKKNPSIKKYACQQLEYGEVKEGYFREVHGPD